MRILQLAARLPYPLTDGGAIGIYKITESLARLGHQITFLTFPDPDKEITRATIADMSRFCEIKLTRKPLPSRSSTIFRTLVKGAYAVERREMKEMYELISSVISSHKFDVVHCDHSHVGKYALWIKEKLGLPVVLRQHNVEAQIYERFAIHARNPAARLFGRIQSKRLHSEERRFVNGVDAIAAISEEDAAIMKSYAPNAVITVIPAGVDLDYFTPANSQLEDPNTITWIGRFIWQPNMDAVKYFLRDIFPIILKERPSTIFHIIGAGGESIKQAASSFGNNVIIDGFVNDIREYLARSSVLVVPLRVGGGMRIKILEFCAAGKTIVSTTIGSEGNIAVNDRDLLLRDTPEQFAEAVIALLADPEKRHLLGVNARILMEKNYSWNSIGKRFSTLYDDIIKQK